MINMKASQIRYDRVLILLVACACIYAYYLYAFPHFHVRYRLTIDVLAGGRYYSEASVVDVNYETTMIGHGLQASIVSRCPSVDLEQNGIIFVIDHPPIIEEPGRVGFFRTPFATTLSILPLDVYSLYPKGSNYARARLNHDPYSGTLAGKVDVPLDRLPMIVRFRDIEDRNSMQELDPNDLSPAFGPGSRIIGATLETTDDRSQPIPTYWPAWIEKASPESIKVATLTKGKPVRPAVASVAPRQIRGF